MFNRKIWTISWKMHYPYEWMYPASDIEYTEKTVTWTWYVDLLTAKSWSLSNLTLFWWTEQDDTDVLQSVVLDWATVQRNVPEWYTELDYLKNVMNSTKFNTWLSPENWDVLELVRTAWTPTVSNYMFQSREWTQAWIYGISWSSSWWTIMWNRWSWQSLQSEILRTNGHKYYTRMSVIWTTLTLTVKDLTDKTENTKTREITETAWWPSKYFLRWNATQAQALWTAQNVYFASITTNGVERIRLIPAKQWDTVWFYDMVSKTFMTTFVGDEPTASSSEATPSPFVPIDIVSNNGTLKVSRNLLNLEDLEWSYLLTDSWQRWSENSSRFLTNFIKVKPSTSYVFDFISWWDYIYRRICWYSSNDYNTFTELLIKKQRPTNEGERYSLQFTTSATTNYIKISSHRFDTNIQLIEWTEAIPYHNYGIYAEWTTETVKDSSNRTATAKNLFKIWDYVDSQEVLSGAITRNIWVKVFDWTESRSRNDTRVALALWDNYNWNDSILFCTHYVSYTAWTSISNLPDMACKFANTDTWSLLIKDSVHNTTLEDWKSYVASEYQNWTPIIIVYQLSTPTTETTTAQTLNVQSWTNKIEITQSSIDNLWISATYLSRE